jgi:hypothetical protein
MKYLFLLFLFACKQPTPSSENLSEHYDLSDKLKGCSVHELKSPTKLDLYVILCPNAETTTVWTRSCGKNCRTTEVVTAVGK